MAKIGKAYRLSDQREWTDQEVEEAKAFLETERPGLWEELKVVIATEKDYSDHLAVHKVMSTLRRLHPNDSISIGYLWVKCQMMMRAETKESREKKDN